ncbi:MAG: GldG family protein, partial [Chloroflexota bacterium]
LLERPERTVEALSSRNVRYGSNTLIMSLAFIGILALVNVLANRYSDRLDLTTNHNFTLSPLSVSIVRKLTQPVQVYAFYQNGNPGRDSFKPLLEEYRKESNLFNYQFVDPNSQPGLARQYNVQFDATTVLVSGTKQQSITGSDEGSVTSALLKLERTKAPVVYYLTGHGEIDFTSSGQDGGSMAKAALEADDYDVRPLNLAATGKVPADASAVIVAGPTSPLLPQETDALEKYLDAGGKAVVMVDKRQVGLLGPLAKRYGVDVGNGVIVDPGLSMPNDPTTPLIGQYQFSPITKDLPTLILPSATSVTPSKTPPAGLQVLGLAQTTSQSWLETSNVAHYDPGVDPRGPLDVLVSVEKTPPASAATPTASQPSMRLVFVGDVAFAMNGMSQLANGDLPPGNKAVLTDSVNWLTANEDLIQVQAKPPADQSLILSNTQVNVLLFGSAVFLPLVVLGAGALVWWNRR